MDKEALMLSVLRKISKTHSIFQCFECKNDYTTNHYDAAKSPVGHLCKKCKSYDGYEINQAFMQKFFTYEPRTGELIARLPVHNREIGSVCGAVGGHGYLMTSIQGKNYLNHRLIWLYMMGKLPQQIDHINHNRLDNRWENLREVNNTDNLRNTGLSKNSRTKINGVNYIPRLDKFRAYITINRKQVYLGIFDCIEDAAAARKAADIKYGFHENHGK